MADTPLTPEEYADGHHPSCCGACETCLRICPGYHGPERRKYGDRRAARTPDVEALDAERLENSIRASFHQLRWCKWSDPGHAVAHDDEDEDGYRGALVTTIAREYADHPAPAPDTEEPDHYPGCPRCEHCACAGVTRKGTTR